MVYLCGQLSLVANGAVPSLTICPPVSTASAAWQLQLMLSGVEWGVGRVAANLLDGGELPLWSSSCHSLVLPSPWASSDAGTKMSCHCFPASGTFLPELNAL